MSKSAHRNFDCPESGEPCVEQLCTTSRCIARIRDENDARKRQERHDLSAKLERKFLEDFGLLDPDKPQNPN